ncbi:uncharacterized protein [Emydura macquarii macquarii]|uniref:uncharacterized protein n=1 Tax=Emydura macquarii macquarii TaxID=1129001 RepID=UPI00352B52EA
MQVNDYITVRIAGRFAISLVYKWQHESVRLSLSPLQCVALPHLEELGQILTRVKLSSKSAKELFKVNRKKLGEKETKKMLKKEPRLSELVKTREIPQGNINHVNNISAGRELRTLQWKIKNILEDWLEHYRMAFGVDSPHIHKTPGLPQRALRKRAIQSADAPSVASVVQKAQEKKRENSGAHKSASLLLAHFQSAPAHNRPWEQSSYSTRISSLVNSNIKADQPNVTQFNLNKYPPVLQNSSISGDKLWLPAHSACPIVLRRILMGQEGKICRCSNHQIPRVADLEYDHLINNPMSALEQIMVVCVSSSLKTNEAPSEDKLEQLYERKNRKRSMPCIQGRLDSFRLFKYDITSADEFTGHKGSLLVQRHNVAPGMFLMYIQGKLLFANYIFNGYSKSAKDLQKQIAKTRSDYYMGYYLPDDFKFRSLEDSLQSYS